ncbi:MAG: GGDEF domain-containing protein [Pirellulales bacterium]
MDTIFTNITNINLPSIPAAVGLAAVATIGYLVGLRSRRRAIAAEQAARTEVTQPRTAERTAIVAKELESIAEQLRRRLAEHHRSVATFQDRITKFCQSRPQSEWVELARDAQDILKPTIKLACELAQAYDGIRRQSTQLMSQAAGRYDLLTGVASRDALVEAIDMHLALARRFDRSLSIAMVDIDNFADINEKRGRGFGDRALRDAARLINDSIREGDIVARIGGEEFVVAMPDTTLDEALASAERLRSIIERKTGMTISAGVAEAMADESHAALLARADVALNGAKAAGRNQVFAHAADDIVPFLRRIDVDESTGESRATRRETIATG